LFGRGEHYRFLDDIGTVEMLAKLISANVVGDLVDSLVDLPANDLIGAGRACVVALRRPHHPLAVGATEKADDQLAAPQIPRTNGLVGAARDEQPTVRRGCHGPDVTVVANEVAEPLTLEV
jgi:hypothetical protein